MWFCVEWGDFLFGDFDVDAFSFFPGSIKLGEGRSFLGPCAASFPGMFEILNLSCGDWFMKPSSPYSVLIFF